MNDAFEISETTVESLLKATPQAVRFFLDRRLGCVGCGFARFCTLGDVTKTYHLNEKKFLEEAQRLVVQLS
jgi:hybrid cluster-associated redox disulfide protein